MSGEQLQAVTFELVEPLLVEIKATLEGAEFAAELAAVGAEDWYSDLTLDAFAVVVTHFSDRKTVYPHAQVYPINSQGDDEPSQLDLTMTHEIAVVPWVRGVDNDIVERLSRAYAAAVIRTLYERRFAISGAIGEIGTPRVRYTDSVASGTTRLGGAEVRFSYRITEQP